ncbi:hypothetical protein LguiA_009645 [Lonicera macranthoides]
MAVLMLVALLLAMADHSSGTWCVCKEGSDSVLQKTLDYACGAGADCTLIKQNGACYNPNTLRAHCSYAVNSYFQKKGQTTGSCDFAGSASISASDPSTAGCVYPSSATSSTPVMTPPSTTTPRTPSTTTPMGSSPLVTTPSTGAFGNANAGLGPSGVGINTDESDGGLILVQKNIKLSFSIPLMFLGLGFLWG